MKIEYSLEVQAKCPADDLPDIYECRVLSDQVIPVEKILEITGPFRDRKIYQEDLTQELHRVLAATVETIGYHSGVKTRVVCGGDMT